MYRIDPSQWTFLKPTDLQVGDVFLCLADGYFNVVRRLITWKTKSLYVHAAIYVEDGMLLDAVRPAITRVRLDALLRRYAHAAVLRQPDAWNPDRQCALALFASKVIAAMHAITFPVLSRGREQRQHTRHRFTSSSWHTLKTRRHLSPPPGPRTFAQS